MELRFYKNTYQTKINGKDTSHEFIEVVNYGKQRQCREPKCKEQVYDSVCVLLPWNGDEPTYGVVHKAYIESKMTEISADEIRAMPQGGIMVESITEMLAYYAKKK